MLERHVNMNTTGMMRGQPFKVLVADPGGKLKLARWRLQSDGHQVYYVKDLSMVEPLVLREEIQVILFNVCGIDDLEIIRRINTIKNKCAFEIVAITGDSSGHLLKMLSMLGVRRTVGRPIDYPQLSAVVKEELAGLKERNRRKQAFERFKKSITAPLKTGIIYKTALDQVKTGILIVDAAGHITFVNRPMSLFLKLADRNVLAAPFEQALAHLSGPFHHSLLANLQTAFRNREVSSNIVAPDGIAESLSWEIKACPIFTKKGEFIGAFVVVEDITDPRRMEKVIIQSEKLAMVGQLAAGAAHEIRNPLTSVRGFIQLLQNELAGTSKAEYINIIITEIDRVNTIVNEFLKLAKPIIPKRKTSDLRDLFEDIYLLVESEAFLKNIEINKDFPDSLPTVQIDREQIKQVLINVIRNSFEAMASSGTLTVRAFELPGLHQVCLEISDTGEGMDEETVKQIFVPFFTTKDNGTGLGLAVSSEIMKSHGGRIEVQSEVGRGTTTRLYFLMP